MSKTIIGFAGRKRAGKTCLSKYLAEKYNGTIVTVADALKHLCCDLCEFKDIEELNYYKDNGTSWSFNKEKYAPIWAKIICEQVFGEYTENHYNTVLKSLEEIYTYNVRELLQFIGTDIIRKYKPNWHVDKMVEAINNATTDIVCVDDIRFPNERDAVEKLGGTVFFIIRPDLTINVSNHESEISLTWPEFEDNRIIINSFTKKRLFEDFDEALNTQFFLLSSNPTFKQCYSDYVKCNEKLGYCGSKKTCYGGNSLNVTEYNFVKHVLINNMQSHNGCIVLHAENDTEMDFYQQMLYGKYCYQTPYYFNTIIMWNPFIIENIKAWL